MKVALCISGQPRSVDKTFPYINQNIIVPNKPDVFIHTWIDNSIIGRKPVSAGGIIASDTIPDNIHQIIQELYNPVVMRVEAPIKFNKSYERTYPQIKVESSLSQRYSVFQSIDSVNMFDEYDAIIRMRFDWAIKTKIRVSDFDLNYLYCPNDCPHTNGVNDQFAFSNQDIMTQYAELHNNIDMLYSRGIDFCDELLLKANMEYFNTPIRTLPIEYEIMRGPDSHLRFAEDFI